MSLHKIRAALVQTLESGGLALPVVYENTNDYTPKADEAWLELFLIPNPPVVVTIGDQGEDEHTGFIQVNLNYPIHEGTGASLAKVDEIRTLFKAGSRHEYQGQAVIVTRCGQNGIGQKVNGFFQSILTIQYRANTPR